ncbi:hypothetical protein [Mesorhizobium sp. B2-3-4]|uniref:hypothetical protein n=1 Tax=Mesorhizobium sp. B2-3-4 TaxID=2589959 RepID=UPI00112BE670|nr:hypothetical protein [Mesorhizobium sp. B2-3-4]TPM39621.1 hypothetical protein FJ967_09070 [Mesorhizobium sp. B2-3-4]
MVTRTVKNEDDLSLLTTYLKGRKRPLTVEITEGRDRSSEQNRLAFKWYVEISEQTGEDREDVRARCKLEIGVPILRKAHNKFRATYDKLIRPLAYAQKLALIRDTEMPVTSLMNVEQMSRYLDIVFRRHAEIGVGLTIPPDRYAFDPEQRKVAA